MGFVPSKVPPNRSNRFDDAPPKSIYGCESLPLSVQYPSPRDNATIAHTRKLSVISLHPYNYSISLPLYLVFSTRATGSDDLFVWCTYITNHNLNVFNLYLTNDWQSGLSMRSLARSAAALLGKSELLMCSAMGPAGR